MYTFTYARVHVLSNVEGKEAKNLTSNFLDSHIEIHHNSVFTILGVILLYVYISNV